MADTRTRVLIVDDRRDQLITLKALLDDIVDDIVCATSGRDALRHLLDPGEFALMLLDIEMPGLDGFELAEMVRQHRVHRQTPIIFVTASGEDMHIQRGYALGAVDYILAPVVSAVLRTKVSVLVDLHRKTQQVRRQAEVLRRRAAQLHSLTSASVGIHSAGSVPDILRSAAEAARDIVSAERVVVSAAPAGERAPPHLVVVQSAREMTKEATKVSVEGSLGRLEAAVRKRGAALRFTKEELSLTAEWSITDDGVPGAPGASAYVGAPLAWSDGQLLGVLQVSGKAGNENFDADDEAVVTQLAHVTSVAVQNRLLGDAREASRLKDEFFTNLSHELRNPLNAVVGWLQLLRRVPCDETARERALSALERNTELLTRLVDDLLDASRIVGKRLTIDTKPMALDDVVRTTLESLRVTAEAKGIRVDCVVDDGPIEVLGDPQRLAQVVWNLLANALKFSASGGRVMVRLARQAGEAALVVEDEGEGIAPDFLPHVFERFRQAQALRETAAGGGLGLGLSIVRAVVELHGGSVSAESQGLGRGARFTVRLPLLRGADTRAMARAIRSMVPEPPC